MPWQDTDKSDLITSGRVRVRIGKGRKDEVVWGLGKIGKGKARTAQRAR